MNSNLQHSTDSEDSKLINDKSTKAETRNSTTVTETVPNQVRSTSEKNPKCQKNNILEGQGYEIIEHIADDDNITIIKANSIATGDIVAIKVLSKRGMSGHCRKQGYSQEIKMIGQLTHPNLIKYHRTIETLNRYYIVMEYAQNRSLSDLLHIEKYFSEVKAKDIYRQLVDVLSYCNARGAIHHDIRSENILFDDSNVLKISLFGFAYRNMLSHCDIVNNNCESADPTAPDYSDIYASGIVLYQMVYGKLPKGYTEGLLVKPNLSNMKFPNEPNVSRMCQHLIFSILTPGNKRISWSKIESDEWMSED